MRRRECYTPLGLAVGASVGSSVGASGVASVGATVGAPLAASVGASVGATVGTLSSTDPDAGETFTYSLSGTDASNFSFDSSGDVSFNTAPDFENPADEGADNTYELTVSVSDGSLSAAKSFTVRITDDPSDNPNTEPTCDVYITEGDIAIQNAEQCGKE